VFDVCKEDKTVHEFAAAKIAENKKANAKGQYRIMRKGKTRRDRGQGAAKTT
jgi:hypothetical protein